MRSTTVRGSPKQNRDKTKREKNCFPKLTIVGDKAGIPRTSCEESIKEEGE